MTEASRHTQITIDAEPLASIFRATGNPTADIPLLRRRDLIVTRRGRHSRQAPDSARTSWHLRIIGGRYVLCGSHSGQDRDEATRISDAAPFERQTKTGLCSCRVVFPRRLASV